MMGRNKLQLEELRTLVAEIEAQMNIRPLIRVAANGIEPVGESIKAQSHDNLVNLPYYL